MGQYVDGRTRRLEFKAITATTERRMSRGGLPQSQIIAVDEKGKIVASQVTKHKPTDQDWLECLTKLTEKLKARGEL